LLRILAAAEQLALPKNFLEVVEASIRIWQQSAPGLLKCGAGHVVTFSVEPIPPLFVTAFVVVFAPQRQIATGIFRERVTAASMREKIRARIAQFEKPWRVES
jgi:hypothetical protein